MIRYFIATLLLLSLFNIGQALALEAKGEVAVNLLPNVLGLSAEEAKKICLEKPYYNNCDIVTERYDETDGFYEDNDGVIYVPVGYSYKVRSINFE